MLQACKYQLKPDLIVVPSSSDPAWFDALSTPCLLVPAASSNEEEQQLHARDSAQQEDGSASAQQEDGSALAADVGPRVLTLKNRDCMRACPRALHAPSAGADLCAK
jgi:hypothetical protein